MRMSKNATLTAPALSAAEGSALSALLTFGTEPDAEALDTDSPAEHALSVVAEARETLATAVYRGAAEVGAARWSMAVAMAEAVHCGASRRDIGKSAQVNATIVGQYVRFPKRLAVVADALGVQRASIIDDSAAVEAVWSHGSRLSDERFTDLAEAVTALVESDAEAANAHDYIVWAADMVGALRGSRKAEAEADAEAETDDDGVTLTVRESALGAAIALIVEVAADAEATDAEREAIAALVATLSA